MRYQVIEKLRGEAWELFSAMDMFFVKVRITQEATRIAEVEANFESSGIRADVYHPDDTTPPHPKAHDGLPRARRARIPAREMDALAEMEGGSRRKPVPRLRAEEQVLCERRARARGDARQMFY